MQSFLEVILLMCVINSIGGAPLQPQKSTQLSPFYHYAPHAYTSPPAVLHPEHRKHFENGKKESNYYEDGPIKIIKRNADSKLFYKDEPGYENWHWNI